MAAETEVAAVWQARPRQRCMRAREPRVSYRDCAGDGLRQSSRWGEAQQPAAYFMTILCVHFASSIYLWMDGQDCGATFLLSRVCVVVALRVRVCVCVYVCLL